MSTAKSRTPLLALVLALGIHIDASAFTSMGARSCGDWVKNAQEKGWPYLTQTAWLVGYLSGIASGTGQDALIDASGESLTLCVTNYCNKNPLENSVKAGNELFFELAKKIKE